MSVTATPPKRHDQDELDVLVDKRRALRVEVGELEARLRALKRIDEVDAADAKLTGLRQEIREVEEQAPTILANAHRDSEAIKARGTLDAQAAIEAATQRAGELVKEAEGRANTIVEEARVRREADNQTSNSRIHNLEQQAKAVLDRLMVAHTVFLRLEDEHQAARRTLLEKVR